MKKKDDKTESGPTFYQTPNGKFMPSVYASALGRYYFNGGTFDMPRQQMYMPLDVVNANGGPIYPQNPLLNKPKSLAYNNQKLKPRVTNLPEIPIHPPSQKEGDSILENIWEVFDPSGFSSYNDVYRSYKKTGMSPQTMLEVAGALPVVGKFGKIIKGMKLGTDIFKEAKLSKALGVMDKIGKVSSANDVISPPSIELIRATQQKSKGGYLAPILPMHFDKGTKIFRDTTALPFAKGGPLNTSGPQNNSSATEIPKGDSWSPDYDLRKFAIENPMGFEAFLHGNGAHATDKYKLPNHPTFSDESMYSSTELPGGQWTENADGTWNFNSSWVNKKNMSKEELQDYFQNVEPGNTLQYAHGGKLMDFPAPSLSEREANINYNVYASMPGRYYSNGGKFLTAGGEYHRIYKNAEGDIMVNHPAEDKGKWDTINLTDKSGANTIAEGVAATKQWHKENPNSYGNGGMIKRADGSYSQRGLWDNIRANRGSGKEPTKEMLAQEKKINANQYGLGGHKAVFFATNVSEPGAADKDLTYPKDAYVYANGGNLYPEGGPIYTYAGRPNAKYKKENNRWLISTDGGNKFIAIKDPTGKRTALLNAQAKPIITTNYDPLLNTQIGDNTRTVIPNQVIDAVNTHLYMESPEYKAKQKVEKAAQAKFEKEQWDKYKNASTLEKVADRVVAFGADPFGMPARVLAGEQGYIPGMGNALVDSANPNYKRYNKALGRTPGQFELSDFQNLINPGYWAISAGNKFGTNRPIEGATELGLMALGLKAGMPGVNTAKQTAKVLNTIPEYFSKTPQIIPTAEKKIVGVLPTLEDTRVAETNANGWDTNWRTGKEPENLSLNIEQYYKDLAHSKSLNRRFIDSPQADDVLVKQYSDEFAKVTGLKPGEFTKKDVALYAKRKEAENLERLETLEVPDLLYNKGEVLQQNDAFRQAHNPINKNAYSPEEEVLIDAYTRGYDDVMNLRPKDISQGIPRSWTPGTKNYYATQINPELEKIILKNKLQQDQSLIRGTGDFVIDENNASKLLRNGQEVYGIPFSGLQEGDVFVPNTFTSTQVLAENTPAQIEKQFAALPFGIADNKPVKYVINAPAGQSYLHPNSTNIKNYVEEAEALLPQKLQFKVDKVVSPAEKGFIVDPKQLEFNKIYENSMGMKVIKEKPLLPFMKPKFSYKKNGEITKVKLKDAQKIFDEYNKFHYSNMPDYYMSILNPYKLGGRLNKKY